MSRPLNILVTADPELPVPPRLYGGIERIIDLLIRGLLQRGHHVTLVAHRDSEVPAVLAPWVTTRSAPVTDTLENVAHLTRVVLRERPDVVQSFSRLAYLGPVLPLGVAKVMSYQREVTPGSVRWGRLLSRGTLQFTSCSRRLIQPVSHLAPWRVIHNAVPLDRYAWTTSVTPDAPLVFLGRIEHIKGVHVAIDVARRAGRRLVIAGTIADEHREYFERHVLPAIRVGDVTYVGPVDDHAKSDLLGRALALLMPVLWDEPFGIVMAEALACGTPVIGFDRGAVAEVVDHGHTGIVCRDEGGMVEGVAHVTRIDRAACRLTAERRFSAGVLVEAYEALYAELVGVPLARRANHSTVVSDAGSSAN